MWLKSEHLKLAANSNETTEALLAAMTRKQDFLVNDLKRLILSINGGRAARLVDATRLYRCETPFEANPKAGFKESYCQFNARLKKWANEMCFVIVASRLGAPRVRTGRFENRILPKCLAIKRGRMMPEAANFLHANATIIEIRAVLRGAFWGQIFSHLQVRSAVQSVPQISASVVLMGSHEDGTPLHCIHIDHDWHHRHDVHLAHPDQGHLS